jgi:hypothetical protein
MKSREIEIIIQSKSQNLNWKVISKIVGSKPETVRCAYRHEMQKRLLPPGLTPKEQFGRKYIPKLL